MLHVAKTQQLKLLALLVDQENDLEQKNYFLTLTTAVAEFNF